MGQTPSPVTLDETPGLLCQHEWGEWNKRPIGEIYVRRCANEPCAAWQESRD